MLTRRATAEILFSHQNRSAGESRLVQYELGIRASVREKTPVEKKKLAETGSLDPLQKLLGNDLVRIDVRARERRNQTYVSSEFIHRM